LKLFIHPYRLQFKYPFAIAHGIRTFTDAVFIAIENEGVWGYGEATLPPYLNDTVQSTQQFLTSCTISQIKFYFDQLEQLSTIDLPGKKDENMPAKAALNMALWDLKGKLENKKVAAYFTPESPVSPVYCTYTLGVSNQQETALKLKDAVDFKLIKLKLDGTNDQERILHFRKFSDQPFAVDANQAWQQLDHAKAMHDFLITQNCFLIEQPFPKNEHQLAAAFKQYSTLPVMADEAFQTIDDLEKIADSYDGINIKLMKCGGISNAYAIIEKAKSLQLQLLIGCMSESACGCAAAAALQSHASFTDLDGPWLINNNPFVGYGLLNGEIVTQGPSGLGISTDLFQP
jgi:L-alanine-DL-glutamate epimerase-like enolase superfamily enzyme